MAYADLGAISPGDLGTSTWANQVRANFQAGVPDIFTTKGDLAVATGADAAARLGVGDDDSILVPDSGEAAGLAWQIQPACRVYRSGDYDPATGSWVALPFGSERFDTDGMHDTGSNTTRITIPTNGDGLYLIGGNVEFDTSGLAGQGYHYGIALRLNGSTYIAREFSEDTMSDSGLISFDISTLYSLSATDYIELMIYTEGDLDVKASGNYSPEFWAIWQRRA
jgi:hypothetical protein